VQFVSYTILLLVAVNEGHSLFVCFEVLTGELSTLIKIPALTMKSSVLWNGAGLLLEYYIISTIAEAI
jgi:hypothetical protein